jgi:hypothetical protein
MKVCYIVLTCNKYFENRVQWQLETMFKHVDKQDIYFLGHTMDVDRRLYSWGAPDDYNGLPYKFVDFFRHLDIEYDWYMFIDDDTYVFHSRLVSLLEQYSPDQLCSIGKRLDHVKDSQWGAYLSGGAGTVLSNSLYRQIRGLLRSKETVQDCAPHWCADICMGIWTRSIPESVTIHYNAFHSDRYNSNTDTLATAITFHKLHTHPDYVFYHTSEEQELPLTEQPVLLHTSQNKGVRI